MRVHYLEWLQARRERFPAAAVAFIGAKSTTNISSCSINDSNSSSNSSIIIAAVVAAEPQFHASSLRPKNFVEMSHRVKSITATTTESRALFHLSPLLDRAMLCTTVHPFLMLGVSKDTSFTIMSDDAFKQHSGFDSSHTQNEPWQPLQPPWLGPRFGLGVGPGRFSETSGRQSPDLPVQG